MRRAPIAIVVGSALLAYASIGNGDVQVNPEVTIVTVTGATGSGSGTATLQNTTTATTYNVLVTPDVDCEPTMTFSVTGGNPIASFGPGATRAVQIGCPPRTSPAMRRCLYHATDNTNGVALADFLGVCLYGAQPGTLTPQTTLIDFGTVAVGESALQTLTLHNDGVGPAITRVSLQTTELDGSYQFSTPCNPDAPSCDTPIVSPVSAGGDLSIQIKCSPAAVGPHDAQLVIGTNTFQQLSAAVSVQCTGVAPLGPVLAVYPSNVSVQALMEVIGDTASTNVRLTNAGVGTLLVNDVRAVDVDNGAALDWTYTASGDCTGEITSTCSLDAGDEVVLAVTFDPSAIGRRRATLLISYRDTLDRTKEVPLDGTGRGATLQLVGSPSLAFGLVPTGRMSSLTFVLANTGNRDTTASLALSAASTPPFSLVPMASQVVSPGTNRTITATCAPTAPGTFTTTVTVEAMDTSSAPITLDATCEGTAQALYANPTALQLGEVRFVTTPAARSVQLLDAIGGPPLVLAGQPQLASGNTNLTLGPVAPALQTPATFDLMVSPQTEGTLSNAIVARDTDDEEVRIPVNGSVVKASYVVAPTVDLGTFCVNQATTSSNLSLVSDGTATIALFQPSLGGAPSPFQLFLTTPSIYPSTLAPGKAASVSVTPLRHATVTTIEDTLSWRTDVENMQVAPTTVSAKFIDSGGAIAPSALDFGKVTVHLYSDDGQRVLIQNCNDTPLVLDPPTIHTPFSIDSPNFPSMLSPNETATLSLGFHPTRVGPVMDTLRITSPQLPGAPLEVTLYGEGVTTGSPPPDGGVGSNGVDQTSFYACTCGSATPGGGGPIVIALGWLLVPRRNRRRAG